ADMAERNVAPLQLAIAAATGGSRSGRYEKLSPLGPSVVCVNSCRSVAPASGLVGANLPTGSSSDSNPSDAQRSASDATIVCVVSSSWKGVSIRVVKLRSTSTWPKVPSQNTLDGPTIAAARPGIPA